MKYELCHFIDSTYELNALVFTYKVGIAQSKNKWLIFMLII